MNTEPSPTKQRSDPLPLLALFSALAYAAVFIVFGWLRLRLAVLPLLTLLAFLSLPLLFIWTAVAQRSLRLSVPIRQMTGPLLLSSLLFPGFWYLFSQVYPYLELLKLALIFSSVLLVAELFKTSAAKTLLYRIGAALFGLLALALLLSQGMTMWPLLWAEGTMAVAAVCLSLYRFLLRLWCRKTALTIELAHFWSVLWSLIWLLIALWISGQGLPLPPLRADDFYLILLWVVLVVLSFFISDEIKNGQVSEGDYSLILSFFLPGFITIHGLMEFKYWPDLFDLSSFVCLVAGSLLVFLARRRRE